MKIKITEDKAKKVLEVAKGKVLFREPFMASVITTVRIKLANIVPTAGTEGYTIYINPSFIQYLSDHAETVRDLVESVAFVLAHEYTHIILRHPERFKEYYDNSRKKAFAYNIASDSEINERLGKDGFKVLKGSITEAGLINTGVLKPEESVYDFSSEQITERILKMWQAVQTAIKDRLNGDLKTEQQIKKGEKGGESCDVREADSSKGASKNNRKEKEKYKAAVDKAISITKQAAKTVGRDSFLANYIIEATKPRRDWKKELQRFLREVRDREEQSWSRIHKKKFYNLGVIYPDRRTSKKLKEIIILVDTSGSISEDELRETAADMLEIFKIFRPKITVIQHTHNITDIKVISKKEEIKHLKIKETGGTDSEDAYLWVLDKLKRNGTNLVIHFTDRYMANNGAYEQVRRLLQARGGALVVVDTTENKLFVNKEKVFREK